jgi:hypothetical protein
MVRIVQYRYFNYEFDEKNQLLIRIYFRSLPRSNAVEGPHEVVPITAHSMARRQAISRLREDLRQLDHRRGAQCRP